jgi:hypothetical protein
MIHPIRKKELQFPCLWLRRKSAAPGPLVTFPLGGTTVTEWGIQKLLPWSLGMGGMGSTATSQDHTPLPVAQTRGSFFVL